MRVWPDTFLSAILMRPCLGALCVVVLWMQEGRPAPAAEAAWSERDREAWDCDINGIIGTNDMFKGRQAKRMLDISGVTSFHYRWGTAWFYAAERPKRVGRPPRYRDDHPLIWFNKAFHFDIAACMNSQVKQGGDIWWYFSTSWKGPFTDGWVGKESRELNGAPPTGLFAHPVTAGKVEGTNAPILHAFADWVYTVCKQFNDPARNPAWCKQPIKMQLFLLLNEQDNRGGIHPEDVARILHEGYLAAKAAGVPDGRIAHGGAWSWGRLGTWWEIYGVNVGSRADPRGVAAENCVLGFHIYSGDRPPESRWRADDNAFGLVETAASWTSFGKYFGVRHPIDGRTKVMVPEGGPDMTEKTMRMERVRERFAGLWMRWLLLSLSTGNMAKLTRYPTQGHFVDMQHDMALTRQAVAHQQAFALLDDAVFLSDLHLGRQDYGLRFRRPDGKMVTGLWTTAPSSSVDLQSMDPTLELHERVGLDTRRRMLDASSLASFHLTRQPVFIVGELREPARMTVGNVSGSSFLEAPAPGGMDVWRIRIQSDRKLDGGKIHIDVPDGWTQPSLEAGVGAIRVHCPPQVRCGGITLMDHRIVIAVSRMNNGDVLEVVYGDPDHRGYFFDAGRVDVGPISPYHTKVPPDAPYSPVARAGFLSPNAARPTDLAFSHNYGTVPGVLRPDVPVTSIHRDVAAAVWPGGCYDFRVDVPPGVYDVKVYLGSPGRPLVTAQQVHVNGAVQTGVTDMVFERVRAGSMGVTVSLARAAGAKGSDALARLVVQESIRNPRKMSERFRTGRLPNMRKDISKQGILAVAGIELLPAGVGAGPEAKDAGKVFHAQLRPQTGEPVTLEAHVGP